MCIACHVIRDPESIRLTLLGLSLRFDIPEHAAAAVGWRESPWASLSRCWKSSWLRVTDAGPDVVEHSAFKAVASGLPDGWSLIATHSGLSCFFKHLSFCMTLFMVEHNFCHLYDLLPHHWPTSPLWNWGVDLWIRDVKWAQARPGPVVPREPSPAPRPSLVRAGPGLHKLGCLLENREPNSL